MGDIDTTIDLASTSKDGLMSKDDKSKLNSIKSFASEDIKTELGNTDNAITQKAVTDALDSKLNKSDNLNTLTNKEEARDNLGLGNVDNTADIDKNVKSAGTQDKLSNSVTINGVSFDGSQNITINAEDSVARIQSSEKGQANGVQTLGADKKIPQEQLPSFVDSVLEFNGLANFPENGETSKIYMDTSTELIYRWSGSRYIEVSPSQGNQDSQTKLQTSRDISITGGQTQEQISFNGTDNVELNVTSIDQGKVQGTLPSDTYTDTKYESSDFDISGLSDSQNVLNSFQEKIQAGSNISLDGNIISQTDTKYTQGSGLELSEGSFKANFGNSSGTIQEGNDSRILEGAEQYSWGNHSEAGYVTEDTKYAQGTGLELNSSTFSVSYGVTLGTQAQGNDSRIINGQTAYDWGNHQTQGYVKTDTTYTQGSGLSLEGNEFSANLEQSDIPNLNASKITEGILDIANGGTGVDSIQQLKDQLDITANTGAGDLLSTNNLSDLTDVEAARVNLDVYSTEEVHSMIDNAQLALGTNFTVADQTELTDLAAPTGSDTDLTVGDVIFVIDDGDSKWAQYKITEIVTGDGTTTFDTATTTKIMDEDIYLNAISAEAIKTAYESNSDTNAYTDIDKGKVGFITVTTDIDLDTAILSDTLAQDLVLSSSATEAPSVAAVKAYVDSAASAGGSAGGSIPLLETVTVVGSKITLSNEPKEGVNGIMNFGTVRYIDGDGIAYDAPVVATGNPLEFIVSTDVADQWDTFSVQVQYLYVAA